MEAGDRPVRVPGCEPRRERRIELEEWERHDLVRRMVEDGIERGLERGIISAAARDGGIGRTVKRMRRRTENQVRDARTSLGSRYDRKVESLRSRWRQRFEKDEAEREDLEREFDLLDEDEADLSEELAGDELVSMVVEGPDLTRWQSFVGWLRRLWYRIVWALARFWRWLTGRKGVKKVRRPRRGGPRLLLRGIGTESRFGEALFSSPTLKREVDKRIKARGDARGDMVPTRDRDEYMQAAVEAFNEYVRERRHEAMEERRRRKDRIDDRLDALKRQEEASERELEKRLEDLARERARELERVGTETEEGIMEEVRKEVFDHFRRMGYIKEGSEGPVYTSRIIDRFAEHIYEREMETLPTRLQASAGTAESRHGSYERGRMRTVHEISKMDMVESLVRARINHPAHRHIEDEDVLINREVSSERNHVVLMFDRSSSMEENDRIMAAKKAVLALYKAVKRANPRNIIDLLIFDTRVRATDLDDLWGTEPSGFTNTGEAIRVARNIIGPSRADKKMIYLITDGLPEAYTAEDGPKAGDREKSLEYALVQASELARIKDQRLIVLLLEPENEMYVEAATSIVKKAAGSLIVTDPKHLAGEMLVDYTAT